VTVRWAKAATAEGRYLDGAKVAAVSCHGKTVARMMTRQVRAKCLVKLSGNGLAYLYAR